MKTLEELKRTLNLVVLGYPTLFPEDLAKKNEMYQGIVKWPDFEGSVMFGMNENGIMEHVSVSSYEANRIPSWEIMCRVKDLFFYPEEMAVQIHPKASRYLHGVGGLNNVLHLWRPKNGNWTALNHPEAWD